MVCCEEDGGEEQGTRRVTMIESRSANTATPVGGGYRPLLASSGTAGLWYTCIPLEDQGILVPVSAKGGSSGCNNR